MKNPLQFVAVLLTSIFMIISYIKNGHDIISLLFYNAVIWLLYAILEKGE